MLLGLAAVGRGGQGDVGQRIRDEILYVQSRNNAKVTSFSTFSYKTQRRVLCFVFLQPDGRTAFRSLRLHCVEQLLCRASRSPGPHNSCCDCEQHSCFFGTNACSGAAATLHGICMLLCQSGNILCPLCSVFHQHTLMIHCSFTLQSTATLMLHCLQSPRTSARFRG